MDLKIMNRNPAETTLTPADLEHWDEPGTHLAVIGDPVRHSLSPAMHNAALARMALDDPRFESWRYWRIETPAEALPKTLELLHRRGFLGMNLTMPHKLRAVALVAHIDPSAAIIGAVNTLRRTPAGFEGFNTDGYGLVEGLRASLGVDMAGANIVLLGAGGAARAAAVACIEGGCRALWIGNRSPGALEILLGALTPIAAPTRVRGFPIAAPPGDVPGDAVIVNATSQGLKHDDPPPVDLRMFPGRPAVFDMIYTPAETSLTREAGRLGLRASSGLSMLVHQGALALELWTGVKPPVDVMSFAAAAALKRS